MSSIKSYSSISNNAIHYNGERLLYLPCDSFEQLADKIYRDSKIAYPKFHKMDSLSKLGFLTAEILLRKTALLAKQDRNKIGVVLSNKNSSLDTDVKYHNLLKKGVASPAIFVYSLPNIVIGEICIRHEIKGENTFFISESYDVNAQVAYVNSLLEAGILDACIGGWVELMENNYQSFLYLAEKEEQNGLMEFTAENVKQLYNKL